MGVEGGVVLEGQLLVKPAFAARLFQRGAVGGGGAKGQAVEENLVRPGVCRSSRGKWRGKGRGGGGQKRGKNLSAIRHDTHPNAATRASIARV